MTTKMKTCLITGCSEGGVGAAFAEAFRDKGYHVFATARSTSKVPQTLHTASNVTVLALDVASSASIAEASKVVQNETGGKLDGLINNAGSGMTMPALDTSIPKARELFDINFFGALEMVQVFSPMLIEAKGCIVNNSSVVGLSPTPFNSMFVEP
jgi:1-acylglycerone phosphate reductase